MSLKISQFLHSLHIKAHYCITIFLPLFLIRDNFFLKCVSVFKSCHFQFVFVPHGICDENQTEIATCDLKDIKGHQKNL